MNKRKRHVADIALQLFIKKGIQQTSIQEIIDQANISKGTFYNYFTSKADCVAEILEGLRYDARQMRMEMQAGKDQQDRQAFIEQISILIQLNEERNLNGLFETILSSNEHELKRLVLNHRLHEIEWLSKRFVDVFGYEIESISFEATILFYGMMQYLLFTMRITNMPHSIEQITEVLLSYIELIINQMLTENCQLIDRSSLHALRANIDRKPITREQLLETAQQIELKTNFTEEQQDLYDAILVELSAEERIRKSVLSSLLKPFYLTFTNSPLEQEVHTFTNMVWYYLKLI